MLLDFVPVYLQPAFSVIRVSNLSHTVKALSSLRVEIYQEIFHCPNITALAAVMHH